MAIVIFKINASITDELIKLANKDYGGFVDKTEMTRDKVLHPHHCFSAFIKRDTCSLDDSFLQ